MVVHVDVFCAWLVHVEPFPVAVPSLSQSCTFSHLVVFVVVGLWSTVFLVQGEPNPMHTSCISSDAHGAASEQHFARVGGVIAKVTRHEQTENRAKANLTLNSRNRTR